jgi:hypothetical protein
MTHTRAELAVSDAAYQEIKERLLAAGYGHAIHRDGNKEFVDMHGIAVTPESRDNVKVYLVYKGKLIKTAEVKE